MGTCMSETTIVANDVAVRPKAQIRQTSHKLVVKGASDGAENGTIKQQQEQRKLKGQVKTYCVQHEKVDTHVHEHILTRRRDYNEPWLCSGGQEEDAC
jgi:hypothetical protein